MKRTSYRHVSIFTSMGLLLCLSNCDCLAEKGFVLVQVQDSHRRVVAGVDIGIDGFGASQLTGSDGKAKLALGNASREGDWLTLSVLHSPRGRDLVMVSPWDSRAQVPSFEDKPENFVRIVVVERKDRAALEDGTVVAALVAKINKANSEKKAGDKTAEDPRKALLAVASRYGLSPEDLDHAIRELGANSHDPYQLGMAALYERNYPKASVDLETSLKQREAKLAADQSRVTQDREQIADAAYFLGYSLYLQGRYRESTDAYRKCLEIRKGDPRVMNNLGLSMQFSGDDAGAEPLFKHALAIDERVLGQEHPDVATVLNNLAESLKRRGDMAGAEALYRRALPIMEKALGPEDPDVATCLSNLALLLTTKRSFSEGESLYKRALAIHVKVLGSEDPEVAIDLNNLAGLLRTKGDYEGAEPLYRHALAIDEKALGPEHPTVAAFLNNLGELLAQERDYAAAEALYLHALAIDRKALGPEHPTTKAIAENLKVLERGNKASQR